LLQALALLEVPTCGFSTSRSGVVDHTVHHPVDQHRLAQKVAIAAQSTHAHTLYSGYLDAAGFQLSWNGSNNLMCCKCGPVVEIQSIDTTKQPFSLV
jgi:hypothetical protein